MTDNECEQLLLLLDAYLTDYPEEAVEGLTVGMLTTDLAMSMDVTTNRADEARARIEAAVGV